MECTEDEIFEEICPHCRMSVYWQEWLDADEFCEVLSKYP